jgi:hypothetical protein
MSFYRIRSQPTSGVDIQQPTDVETSSTVTAEPPKSDSLEAKKKKRSHKRRDR